ncbi:CotH kinase family protein [Cellulosilyticum sp. I15G10I2]|uniref:CotH kinase family protein n=1 Tax=Cellulosilyticum sp. I15G10I2 TaxID=1892843 RepID=UPI00085C2643|nr:CotH kinase family protein [Cellulosilyticum sp. I15G10I2]
MKNIGIKQLIAAVSVVVVLITGVFLNTNVIGATTSQNTKGYEKLFQKDKVIDIRINVSDADLESMMSDPLAEEYKSATVKVGGVTVENVGFRTKGNSTLKSVAGSDSDRYSFRIKLDKYVKGQTLLGLDEFVVNNMYSDPSYMREYLSYEALRAMGVDVPLTAFANVYINDELFGFYLCVEALDDSFIERSFGDDSGSLYKQEQGSTLQYVADSNYDKSELKIGKDKTKTDLKNFIKVLNEMPTGQKGDIESVLDVDSALKYIAVNTVLGNYDSYNGNFSHNYYLYGQDGRFTVIPWDYNMSIAGFGGGNQTTIPIDQPVVGVDIKNLPLINNLLAVEAYKQKYYTYIEELNIYLENFEQRVTQVANIIRPYVKADPTKFYTMEQFEASITYSETEVDELTNAAPSTGRVAVTDGQSPVLPNMPEDFTPGERPEMPTGQRPEMLAGERPEMPMGERPERLQGVPGDMKNGRNGGMGMQVSSVSIVNFIKARVENVKAQLSGSISTTGNTTMNNTVKGK